MCFPIGVGIKSVKTLDGKKMAINEEIFNPIEILRTLSEIGENITRLGEF